MRSGIGVCHQIDGMTGAAANIRNAYAPLQFLFDPNHSCEASINELLVIDAPLGVVHHIRELWSKGLVGYAAILAKSPDHLFQILA